MKNLLLTGSMFICACTFFEPQVLAETQAGVGSERASALYEKGNSYFKDKEYRNAIQEFAKIIADYQYTDVYEPALYLTAFSYFKLDNYKESASLGEKLLKDFPSSSYLLNTMSLIGESFYKLNENYKATYYLTKYYTLTSDSTGRSKSFAHILEILPELSLKELEKLHRIFLAESIDEHILYYLAQIEAREGKKQEAERDFNLLLKRFPDTQYTFEVEEYKRFIRLGEATGRIGILLALSGEYSQVGQELFEIVKFFEHKKLPFSLHVLDTKSDPIEATLAASKLIDDIHVDFLIAPVRLIEAFGICGLAYGKGTPVVLPVTSEARFENVPFIYTAGQSDEEQARLIAQYAIWDLGIKNFAVLYPDQVKYKDIADAFVSEVVNSNRTIATMVSFRTDSITLKAELEIIQKKEPEAIFLPMDEKMLVNTTPQIAYYGLEGVQLLGIETFKNERVPRLGEKYVEGATFAAPAPIDSSALREFRAAGFKENELAAKFFYTLWQLQNLGTYDRSMLPRLLSKAVKEKAVTYIYRIENGEFTKIKEVVH